MDNSNGFVSGAVKILCGRPLDGKWYNVLWEEIDIYVNIYQFSRKINTRRGGKRGKNCIQNWNTVWYMKKIIWQFYVILNYLLTTFPTVWRCWQKIEKCSDSSQVLASISVSMGSIDRLYAGVASDWLDFVKS